MLPRAAASAARCGGESHRDLVRIPHVKGAACSDRKLLPPRRARPQKRRRLAGRAAALRSSSARSQRRRPHSGATAPPGITCGASCGARGLGTGGTLCGRVSKPPESTPARGKCGTVPSGTPHSSSTQPRRSCRKPHAFHVISARDMAQTARAARDSRPTRAVQRTPQPRHTPRFTP